MGERGRHDSFNNQTIMTHLRARVRLESHVAFVINEYDDYERQPSNQ